MDCRIDYPKTASAMTAVVSIVLYFFDLATDIWLAVDYFKDGQTTWGGLTTVCICFPIPVFLILAIYMACAENGGKKMPVVLTILFFPFLLITNLFGMLLHVCRQSRNIKSKTEDNTTCDADESKASEINGDKTTETYNNKTCEADHNKASEIDDNKTSEAYDNKTFEMDNRTTCNADDNKTSEADYNKTSEVDDNKTSKAGDNKTSEVDNNKTSKAGDNKTSEVDNNKTSKAGDNKTSEVDDNKTSKAGDNKTSEVDDNKTSKAGDNKVRETVDRAVRETVDKAVREAVDKAGRETVDKAVRETVDKAVREAVDKAVREKVDRAVDSKANETEDGETSETDYNKTDNADDGKTHETDDKYYRLATMAQVLDAVFESFPQLVLQIYILLADESIRNSTDIGTSRIASMVGSILMLSWSLTCYEKMKFYMINEENIVAFQRKPRNRSLKQAAVTRFPLKSRDMPIGGQITVYVLKLCECLLRVFTFGLLASILQPLRPPFIILIIVGIIVAHFALLTLADCLQDWREINLESIWHLLYAAIRRVVSYITIYGQPNDVFRIVYYYIIVLVESIIFIILWLQFKPDRLAWVSSYAWMTIFPVALLMCALCVYMYYCKRFHNNAAFMGYGKLDIEHCRFLED